MDDIYRTLINDFVEEAMPLAERLTDAFLEIERLWSDGRSAEEILPQVKSDLHTLKGNSGLMGLVPIQSLTHSLEDICKLVSDQPQAGTTELADLLLQGSDQLVEMVQRSLKEQLSPDYCDDLLEKLDDSISRVEGSSEVRQEAEAKAKAGHQDGTREKLPETFDDTVRIDFRKLDGLLEMVGEAMVSRSMLHDAQKRIWPTSKDSTVLAQLDRSMQSLDMTLKRLQEGLVETRLLPVSRVFRRFTRKVRDLAREQGKSVKLVTVGSDTTIDKAIIDKLGEPLLHLVVNSVAHGIEPPEERDRTGKPPEATIELRAEQLSDRVVISVSDDGKGLDDEKIASRGRELGYDTSELAGVELYPLIFQPGFSTAADVSTLSGRGVGLDVVASTIEAIGGSISVDSKRGEGVVFRLDLPLTLAVVKALFVDIHDEVYALPLSYVEESFRIDEEAIHLVDGKPSLPWRGRLIELVDGGDLLGATGADHQSFCVVISTGSEKRGLRVGGLKGHRDVVVKGLETALGQQDLLSGVTILGDGRVVFILDATRITGGTFGGGVPFRQDLTAGGAEAGI